MLLLSLSLALAAADTSPAAQTPTPAEQPAAKKEKKICKVDHQDTGSRMRKRLCLTETEWARREAGKSVGEIKTIGGR